MVGVAAEVPWPSLDILLAFFTIALCFLWIDNDVSKNHTDKVRLTMAVCTACICVLNGWGSQCTH